MLNIVDINVTSWANKVALHLNPDKTKAIYFGFIRIEMKSNLISPTCNINVYNVKHFNTIMYIFRGYLDIRIPTDRLHTVHGKFQGPDVLVCHSCRDRIGAVLVQIPVGHLN